MNIKHRTKKIVNEGTRCTLVTSSTLSIKGHPMAVSTIITSEVAKLADVGYREVLKAVKVHHESVLRAKEHNELA